MLKKITYFLIIFFGYFLLAKNSFALTFDLIAPTEQLQRGQEVKFTINIDTEGKSYASVQIGITYDTQYLEFISVSPGDTFSTISSEPAGDGKLIIKGSTESSYSGSGVFAYVTFKLIASSPGSTQLCALFNPENTPTPKPTSHPPSVLPTSGDTNGVNKGVFVGLLFLILAGSGLVVFKNI